MGQSARGKGRIVGTGVPDGPRRHIPGISRYARIFARSTPDKRACRSSSGECEPDSAAPEGRAEPDSFRALFPEFRLWRIYLALAAGERAPRRSSGGYANRIWCAPKKRTIKIFSDISPDHRGREKYTRNFAPLAARMLRTGSRALCARGTVRFVRSTSKKAGHLLVSCFFGGATRNRTGDRGVADLCLTAWPSRLIAVGGADYIIIFPKGNTGYVNAVFPLTLKLYHNFLALSSAF